MPGLKAGNWAGAPYRNWLLKPVPGTGGDIDDGGGGGPKIGVGGGIDDGGGGGTFGGTLKA